MNINLHNEQLIFDGVNIASGQHIATGIGSC